ncbi:hypothetical protein HMPREF1380_02065, partial [Enterococcus faecium R499]
MIETCSLINKISDSFSDSELKKALNLSAFLFALLYSFLVDSLIFFSLGMATVFLTN